jgi:hypothetical protein
MMHITRHERSQTLLLPESLDVEGLDLAAATVITDVPELVGLSPLA